MKTKRTSRLLSVLLTLVMVLAMLPGTALAAPGTVLSEVEISGVVEPVQGAEASYAFTLGDEDLFDGTDFYWVVTEAKPNDYSDVEAEEWKLGIDHLTYEPGLYYTALFMLTPASSVAVPNLVENIAASVNGENADIVNVTAIPGTVILCKTYEAAAATQNLELVTVNNLAEPAIGETPQFDCDLGSENYRVWTSRYGLRGITWSVFDHAPTGAEEIENAEWYYESDFTFREGQYYALRLLLVANAGYQFAETVEVVLNEKTPTYVEVAGRQLFIYMVYGPLEEQQDTEIVEVILNNVQIPVAGETVDWTIPELPDDAEYDFVAFHGETPSIRWIEYSESSEDATRLDDATWYYIESDTFTFREGMYYTLVVNLKPNKGYTFPSDSRIDAYIGDVTSRVRYVGEDEFVGSEYILVSREFYVSKAAETVAIEGVKEPAVGEAPAFDVTVTGDGYLYKDPMGVDQVTWYVLEEAPTDLDEILASTAYTAPDSFLGTEVDWTFEAGKYYVLRCNIGAVEGYGFTKHTAVTVNGAEPTFVRLYDGDLYVYQVYTPQEEDVLTFSDVQPDDWFFNAVNWAVENGVTAGMGDGTFGSNNVCTRAQIVTFMWNNAGKPETGIPESPFTDVKEGDWYYNAVLWAYENGITAGMGDDTFGVNLPCTRAQAVTFMWNADGKPEPTTTENPFTDVKEDDWFYQSVLWAVEHNITAGMGNGAFGSNNVCTRAHIVTFLWNAAGKPIV